MDGWEWHFHKYPPDVFALSWGLGIACTTIASPHMEKGKKPPPADSFIPWLKEEEDEGSKEKKRKHNKQVAAAEVLAAMQEQRRKLSDGD